MSDSNEVPPQFKDVHVLERAVDKLSDEYLGIFSPETIQRYVFESYATLGRTPKVRLYLAKLAVRFASDRLAALAHAKGARPSKKPQVLFVCVQNAGRSQIAAALMEWTSLGAVDVRSAGSLPSGEVSSTAVALLEANGIDIKEAYPKPLTDDVVRASDYVITMGCGDACPIYPGKQYLDWDVADLDGATEAEARVIYEDIRGRVQSLWKQLSD